VRSSEKTALLLGFNALRHCVELHWAGENKHGGDKRVAMLAISWPRHVGSVC
jgi:hypothetical protein